MRALMRREVNLDDLENRPPDMDEIQGIEKLKVILRMAVRDNSLYKLMHEKNENKELKKRLQMIDDVKEVILIKLNKELKTKRVVDICIARKHLDIVDDIFSAPEFISYKIDRIMENHDILLAFGDSIPLRFRIEVL